MTRSSTRVRDACRRVCRGTDHVGLRRVVAAGPGRVDRLTRFVAPPHVADDPVHERGATHERAPHRREQQRSSTTTTTARSTTAAPTTSAPRTPTTSPARPVSSGHSHSVGPTNGARPVIVLDPGHSPTVHHIDRRTGLNVSDYENEPEMDDVYEVALLVRHALQKAGYRVVMTKTSVNQRVNLARRAYLANRVHAALAISIHDQAGDNGGIGFRQGNNTVYYQSVGTYRQTPGGTDVYFRNRRLAAVSKDFGTIFRRQRANAQHVNVNLQGNVGYDLGSRGLAPGDIWIVQLLSKVPWVYNEAGGNSAGRSGLNRADERTYARGLIAGVEHSVPLPSQH